MPSFFDLLEARVKAVDSLLCVGLDPHIAQVSAIRLYGCSACLLGCSEAQHILILIIRLTCL